MHSKYMRGILAGGGLVAALAVVFVIGNASKFVLPSPYSSNAQHPNTDSFDKGKSKSKICESFLTEIDNLLVHGQNLNNHVLLFASLQLS